MGASRQPAALAGISVAAFPFFRAPDVRRRGSPSARERPIELEGEGVCPGSPRDRLAGRHSRLLTDVATDSNVAFVRPARPASGLDRCGIARSAVAVRVGQRTGTELIERGETFRFLDRVKIRRTDGRGGSNLSTIRVPPLCAPIRSDCPQSSRSTSTKYARGFPTSAGRQFTSCTCQVPLDQGFRATSAAAHYLPVPWRSRPSWRSR